MHVLLCSSSATTIALLDDHERFQLVVVVFCALRQPERELADWIDNPGADLGVRDLIEQGQLPDEPGRNSEQLRGAGDVDR